MNTDTKLPLMILLHIDLIYWLTARSIEHQGHADDGASASFEWPRQYGCSDRRWLFSPQAAGWGSAGDLGLTASHCFKKWTSRMNWRTPNSLFSRGIWSLWVCSLSLGPKSFWHPAYCDFHQLVNKTEKINRSSIKQQLFILTVLWEPVNGRVIVFVSFHYCASVIDLETAQTPNTRSVNSGRNKSLRHYVVPFWWGLMEAWASRNTPHPTLSSEN